MRAVWNIIKTVFKAVADLLVKVFTWVWENPVKGIAAGLGVVAIGWLFSAIGWDEFGATLATFGWAMVTTGITSYVVDPFGRFWRGATAAAREVGTAVGEAASSGWSAFWYGITHPPWFGVGPVGM
jgi:hypothetical protein